MQTGESQLVRSVPPDSWPQWSGNPKFKTAITPQGGIGGALELNVKKAPTDDVKVRQALNYLIDKKEVSLGAFGGLYQPAYSVLSPVTNGYEPKSELYKFDEKKGLALLDEAGWKLNPKTGKREKDGQVLKLEYLTLTGVQNVAVIVKGLLEEYGMEVNILAEDNPAQQADAQAGKHNIVWTGWSGTEPDLLTQLFSCANIGTGWNFCHYCDPKAEELMTKGATEPNAEKRYQYYKDLQVKLMEDATVVPLYVVGLTWAMVPDLMGFRTLAGEQIMLHEMYRLLE
jgi:peptide/nickel transport system substrate-binding protein